MNYDEPNISEEKKLPEGKTCGDCFWFSRCFWLVGADRRSKQCDWAPSKFKENKI
jgi:hypothetical protein